MPPRATALPPPAGPDAETAEYRAGVFYPTATRRLWFTTHVSDAHTEREIQRLPSTFFFSSTIPESYQAFCDDFGPVDIRQVVRFVREVQARMTFPAIRHRLLVFYTYDHPHCVTNSVFLLCAYLVLVEGFSPVEALAPFESIYGLPIKPFHDATFVKSTYPLTILDCLSGLCRARDLGWFDLSTFNLADYDAMYDQETHDICKVSPGLVALATPKDEADEFTSKRRADVHVPLLKELGVTDIVRLNESAKYNEQTFAKGGIRHHTMQFPDCTVPSPEIVKEFLDLCDTAHDTKGVVAVHCLAGLGRTGTLIGVNMIKNHGFSAAEAIGWMRLVRPGSVIGVQQQYLSQIQGVEWRGNSPCNPASPGSLTSKRVRWWDGGDDAEGGKKRAAEELQGGGKDGDVLMRGEQPAFDWLAADDLSFPGARGGGDLLGERGLTAEKLAMQVQWGQSERHKKKAAEKAREGKGGGAPASGGGEVVEDMVG